MLYRSINTLTTLILCSILLTSLVPTILQTHAHQLYPNGEAQAQSISLTSSSILPQVVAGYDYTCVINVTGELYCWGGGDSGGLAIPNDLGVIKQISTNGSGYTCVITEADTVRCWGSSSFAPPSNLGNALEVSVGGNHSCAITSNQELQCWGANTYGESTVPTDLGEIVQVSAGGSHTCAITALDGLACWGANGSGQSIVPADLGSVTAVGAGNRHTCAITSDSNVRCWGANTYQQVVVPADLGNVVSISVRMNHVCAVTSAGLVRCWGENQDGQTNVPNGLNGVRQVSTGFRHTCALTVLPTLYCWGDNTVSQSNIPRSLGIVDQIAVGGAYNCSVNRDGDVQCWGANNYGQTVVPADLTNALQISAGSNHTCAVTSAGALRCWGANTSGQTNVPADLGSVDQVSAGGSYTCAITSAGALRCWGTNTSGQTNVPADLGSVEQVSAGANHTCVITSAGTLRCWGLNSSGQTDVPANLGRVIQVSTTWNATCAVTETKTLRCWGTHYYSQIPNEVPNIVQASTSSHHICAVTSRGELQCWGEATYGQSIVPQDLPRVRQVGVGSDHTCVITESGDVRCWGYNIVGQTSTPANPFAQRSADCLQFIGHQNYPDGTVVSPGQTFAKYWQVKNCGTNAWDTQYQAVRVSGTYGPASFGVHGASGASIDLDVALTAPTLPGVYRASYRLVGPSGPFGDPFSVEVEVRENPAPTYTISGRVTSNAVGLTGVRIAAIGATSAYVLSGANGDYSLSGLPAGSYRLSAEREGYIFSAERTIVVPPNATSQDFTGTVASPVILIEPADVQIQRGERATLRVSFLSGAPVTFQWYTGQSGDTRSPITGAQAESYTSAPLDRTSQYWVRITNSGGSVASRTATVTVNAQTGSLPNLSIQRVEVVQAIQGEVNSVPMIVGKPTLARVHIGVDHTADVPDVTAVLHGFRNGVALPGSPLQPLNPNRQITARRALDPNQAAHTLNFSIPRSWHDGGVLALSAEVNPSRTITERSYTDNRSPNYLTPFLPIQPLEIVLVPVNYRRISDNRLFPAQLQQADLFGLRALLDMYPIANITIRLHTPITFEGDLSDEKEWGRLLNEIGRIRFNEQFALGRARYHNAATEHPKYYGLVSREWFTSGIAGMAYTPGTAGVGIIDNGEVAAHEIGHTFGLRHIAGCGEPVAIDTDYPNHPNARIGTPGFQGSTRTIIPNSRSDMMSYCNSVWISPYHYDKLLNLLNNPRPGSAALAQIEQDAWLVSGSITDLDTAKFDPALPVQSTEIVTAPGVGPYQIELLAGQAVQFSYAFSPMELSGHGDAATGADFAFVVPRSSDITQIRLIHDERVIATLATTGQPPLITATISPSQPTTSTRTLTWQIANVPTGVIPETQVRYSPDAGQTWQVLTSRTVATNYDLDQSFLSASPNGLIELIVAYRGVSSTTQVALGPIQNKPPLVSIAGSPVITAQSHELITLIGSGIDYEDGLLADRQYQWFAANGSFIATGPTVEVTAPPVGRSSYTLTATDQAGLQTTATIMIQVDAANRLYLPLLRR